RQPRPSLPYESLEIVFVRTPRIPISSPRAYRFAFRLPRAQSILIDWRDLIIRIRMVYATYS
ncbi:hypothetical protein WG66_014344, partial [Moniliophthora roreri]